MADARGYTPKSSLGMELRAGHIHRDRHGRSPAPLASHRPVRQKKRVQPASSHASESANDAIPERAEALELPRLRVLEAQAAAVPVSSSAASSVSPRSGSSRVHPYPVGEVVEGSSFELVPSMATQAAQSWEHEEAMEITPVREVDVTPLTPLKPEQVMSPNLGEGMASSSTQGAAEQEVDPAMARAILQSWSETKGEDGTVSRTYTQCAQAWPLTDAGAFESIEVALNVLKRACEYLHEGMTQMGVTMEQKANILSVQAAVRELAEHIQDVRNGVRNSVARQNELSAKIDGMAEQLQAARGRMEMVTAQLEQGHRGQASQAVELKQSLAETQRQVTQMGTLLELSQVDSQRLEQGLTDLKENVYLNSAAVDRLREDCKREAERNRTLSGQTVDIEAYQEHARSNEQALDQCRSQMAAQAGRIEEGEQQLRRLRKEMAELTSQNAPRVEDNVVPNRDPELAIRLSQLEEGMKNQQRALRQLQQDSYRGCQVH